MVERLVVLRALGLGDLCAAVPALRGLRRAYPQAELTLAAPAWLAPLVQRIGAVDRLVPVAPLSELPAELHQADVAVNLHGRGPQSSQLLARSVPGQLLAYRHEDVAATAAGPQWPLGGHEVDRWCGLLAHYGVPCDPRDLRIGSPSGWADAPPAVPRPAAPAAPYVLVHLGASAPARQWPATRWLAVVQALMRWGYPVVLSGAEQDLPAADYIAGVARLPPSAAQAGRTSLDALIELVAAAALVLVGDTGVGHLATAFGRPSVVLFGPVSPSEWGPRHGPHRCLWAGGAGDPHAGRPHPGLLQIKPVDVLDAARQLLQTAGDQAWPDSTSATAASRSETT